MRVDLSIRQGATFTFVFRWETTPIVYRPITAIAAQAPVRITATGHGLPDGWRAAVVSCEGMDELRATTPPRASHYHPVTVIDANTVEMNEVNAASYEPYVSGGYLQFYTPVDMASYTARMNVRNKVGGTLLAEYSTANSGLAVDNAAKTITLNILATATDDFTFTRAVYDLEMVSPTGVVTPLAEGPFAVTREVTTTT